MKTKKQRTNLNSFNILSGVMAVLFIFLIVIFLILFFSIVKINYETEKIYDNNHQTNIKSVEISTDKNVYDRSEKINLTVENNEKQSIYFEPCEYLNNFEKKINGKWERENAVVNNNDCYNQHSFNKSKNITECKVESPKSGEGIYRFVIQIYYNCLKPGYCDNSKTFYSNEFEIKNAVKKCGC